MVSSSWAPAGLWQNRCRIQGMENSRKEVRIVLVRPRNPLNIAAAARAARNFGFEDLTVVAPYEPVWEEARAATGAKRWLRHARVVSHLLEAVEDRNWVLGTSCLSRRRSLDPNKVLPLDGLSAYATKQKRRDRIAILFGSEKRGLSNEDLSYCHSVIRIPTTEQSPSMNLGQAVAVCCYELRSWRIPHRGRKKGAAPCAGVGEIIRLVEEIEKLLCGTVALPAGRERKRKARLQQMLLRWPLTSQDVALALSVLRDLAWRLQ